jgi:aspartate kinase
MSVLKFGGSCLQSIESIKKCASYLTKRKNESLVVVVSAMGNFTNDLCSLSKAIDPSESDLEHDVVRSTGEQISAGLLTLALKKNDVKAKSYLAWQLPIYTDNKPCSASVRFIETRELLKNIEQGVMSIVTGYQGLTTFGRLTTLGRGGSDLTAVAIACSLKHKKCELFKDVDGVYGTDPLTDPNAKLVPYLSYLQILRIIQRDKSCIVQEAAILMAQKYGIEIHIKPFLKNGEGTIIGEKNYAL